MKYYIMAFVPQPDGSHAIFSADFREIASQGKTLDECMDMAQDALAVATEAYLAQGDPIPEPCDMEEAARRIEKLLRELDIAIPKNIVYQLVAAPVGDLHSVRVTATFSRWMLELIDIKARERGMTRSGFLAAAAKAYD